MPILWRYFLSGYLRIFSLSVFSFLSVLLVSRFKEIARFAALSANLEKTFLFTLYQIPLILPIAIPISALIASLLLFQKMSLSSELTAFRSLNIRLSSILAPLLFLSIGLSLFNFIVCGNLSPYCRRASKELLYYETSTNPLLLLQRQNLAKMKKSFIKMKVDEEATSAKDFILITYNQSNQRLSLLTAKKITISDSSLVGTDVALLTHLGSDKPNFDPLIIENESLMSTDASTLSSSLKKNRPRLEAASLEFPLLRLHSIGKGKKSLIEMLRRISLSLAPFTFTLLGCIYGIEERRSLFKKNLFKAVCFTIVLLSSYLLGKELKSTPILALSLFLLPHPLIWAFCIRKGCKT